MGLSGVHFKMCTLPIQSLAIKMFAEGIHARSMFNFQVGMLKQGSCSEVHRTKFLETLFRGISFFNCPNKVCVCDCCWLCVCVCVIVVVRVCVCVCVCV